MLSDEPGRPVEPVAAHDRLRAAGLRSTPQRQAILAAFRGGDGEHLSADEVYSRALVSLPGLGRGTVYATLAEFTEIELLAAFGTPEPVRYETNTTQHGHFRCRLCLRIYDVDVPAPDPTSFERHGHVVDSTEVRAEGICHNCGDYEAGIVQGVSEIEASGASGAMGDRQVAAIELNGPLGPLMLAATEAGLIRLAFAEHGDVDHLRKLAAVDGPAQAKAHLAVARQQLAAYLSGEPRSPVCAIDWEAVDGEAVPLCAAFDVPYGAERSYHLIAPGTDAHRLGYAFGANPIPIFVPCHRVSRGSSIPDTFVGGLQRRNWLLERERTAAGR
jgi:methylated-DNA-[protein]-cysteine S-methyltransferase